MIRFKSTILLLVFYLSRFLIFPTFLWIEYFLVSHFISSDGILALFFVYVMVFILLVISKSYNMHPYCITLYP